MKIHNGLPQLIKVAIFIKKVKQSENAYNAKLKVKEHFRWDILPF